jgi:serine/threonine-protein kinase
MIAYECLAGRRAFDGENAVQIALRQIQEIPEPLPADIPDPVRSLIGRALLKDPAQRFPDGAAFRDAAADVLAGREVPAPPTPLLPFEPVTTPLAGQGRPARRGARAPLSWRRALVPVAALVAGAVIGIGALEFLGGSAAPPTAAGSAAGGGVLAGGSPAAVRLVAADYVGRPYRQVEAELMGLGVRVVLTTTQAAATAPGLVTTVDPVGTLHPGDRVTVTYALGRTSLPAAKSASTVELAVARPAPAPAPASSPPAASGGHGAGSGGSGHGGSGNGGSGNGGSGHGAHHGKGHGKGHGGGNGGGNGHHGKGPGGKGPGGKGH